MVKKNLPTSAIKCKGCKHTLGKSSVRVQCTGVCNQWYHGTTKCTLLDEKSLNSVISKKIPWVSEECYVSEESDEISEDEEEEEQQENKSMESKIDKILSQNNLILKKLQEIRRENDQLKDELNGFKRETQEIRKELNTLKMEMEQSKQKNLKSNIVVTGTPVTLHTDIKTLNSAVMKIAGKLNININGKDFVCSKIEKDTSKQIKVKFHNSEKKDEIMEAKKKVLLNTHEIGFEEKIRFI
ncbi:hypothetical protein WA026_009223 [Henosepilachna vigintioctopunctata]|uniref:Uncharacterized protein n=1 Tax=Henosepilachna vigintioctopunctata TaxID=420089 RepID=A0AAW1UVS4_9CUCU